MRSWIYYFIVFSYELLMYLQYLTTSYCTCCTWCSHLLPLQKMELVGPRPARKIWPARSASVCKSCQPCTNTEVVNTPRVLVGVEYCEWRGRESTQPMLLPMELPWHCPKSHITSHSWCQAADFLGGVLLIRWFPPSKYFDSGSAFLGHYKKIWKCR